MVMRPLVVGSALLLAAACTGDDLRTIPRTGELELVPGKPIDFGFVTPGRSRTATFTIRNVGSGKLKVEGIGLADGSNLGFAVDTATGFTLPIDDSSTPIAENERVVTVTFAPGTTGLAEGKVVIRSDDADEREASVRLSAFGGGPKLVCDRYAVVFGQVAVGMDRTEVVRCTNGGTDDPRTSDDNLRIDDIRNALPHFMGRLINDDGSTVPPPMGYAVGQGFDFEVSFLPGDEGQLAGDLVLATNDELEPEQTISVVGRGRVLAPCNFAIRPPTVRFGIVEPGEEATLDLQLANLGTEECIVSDLRLEDGSDPAFTVPALAEGRLLGGQTIEIPITVAPSEVKRTLRGAVTFRITDPAREHQRVELVAASQEPCLAVLPGGIDFGDLPPGCGTRPRTLQVVNACNDPLEVTRIGLEAVGTDEFAILDMPALPHVLAEGDALEVELGYTPSALGDDQALLVLEAAAGDSITAPLTGTGVDAVGLEEIFQQGDHPKVDVLWVIDNSASMDPYQAQLADNLPAFLQYATDQGLDFHLGVTTTGLEASTECPGPVGGGEDGRLFPLDGSGPRILTPATTDLEQSWSRNVSVGACHRLEQGLEAAKRALSSPVIDSADDPRHEQNGDGNLGFVRPDAHLSVIFLSNEDDQSTGTLAHYDRFFRRLKGTARPDLFSLHAIVGDPVDGCSSTWGRASAGTRYLAMAAGFGGFFQSLCATDWSASLARIGPMAFGARTRFELANACQDRNGNGSITDAEGEVSVVVAGEVVPSKTAGGSPVWRYDVPANSIVFEPEHVPAPGTEIRVSCELSCF